ncbi:MAG TPA: hypothetical protein VG370_08680, partial [Chloroflexota bacterium]|nr:hypothetical protein [Chloroflexota bacterium]
MEYALEVSVFGSSEDNEPGLLEVRAPIDFLLVGAEAGFQQYTGVQKEGWSRRRKEKVPLEQVEIYHAGAFQAAVKAIEGLVYAWASQHYAALLKVPGPRTAVQAASPPADQQGSAQASTVQEPTELFYSYSHKHEALRDELETHLSVMRRNGLITNWHDRRIGAGTEWKGQIDAHLES